MRAASDRTDYKHAANRVEVCGVTPFLVASFEAQKEASSIQSCSDEIDGEGGVGQVGEAARLPSNSSVLATTTFANPIAFHARRADRYDIS